MYNVKGEYDDIINLPHHVSKKHKPMSLENRSAQFAPFSALTGFGDEIIETGRLTERKIELNEEQKEVLDNKLKDIKKKLRDKPKVTIEYFVKDKRKSGGRYIKATGNVIKIDEYKQEIALENSTNISITDIVNIEN